VVYIAIGFATLAWQAWVLFLAYAVFYALTEPAEKTLVTQLVPEANRGLAFGWFNFAIGVAALPASVIFGWLYNAYGAPIAFGWGAALALLSVALLTLVRSPEPRTEPHDLIA
jgi:MFS family permease